jgi:hypothetical protein
MEKGYHVYATDSRYDQPVASFTSADNAEKFSEFLSSHKEPTPIYDQVPEDIDKYIPHMESGLIPFDVFLTGDGEVFEIDPGGGGLLIDPAEYYPTERAFSGTFWASDRDQAIELARTELEKFKQNI